MADTSSVSDSISRIHIEECNLVVCVGEEVGFGEAEGKIDFKNMMEKNPFFEIRDKHEHFYSSKISLERDLCISG